MGLAIGRKQPFFLKHGNLPHLRAARTGLYVVATSLGNARDITLRALDVLHGVDIIYCEDTRDRQAGRAYAINTQRRAYHEHNAAAMRRKFWRNWLPAELALVSDAGTPLISDPGNRSSEPRARRSCRFCCRERPPQLPLERFGPATDRFTFVGFLPAKSGKRRQALADIADQEGTLVLFEAPRRLPALLADIVDRLGDREVSVAREMTKKFETVITAPASALAAGLGGDMLRGECVVLIAPRVIPAEPDGDELDALLKSALEGFSLRDAVSQATRATGLSRRTVYDRALMLNKNKKNPNDKGAEKQNLNAKYVADSAPSN